MIRVEHLCKSFGSRQVLRDVSVELQKGDCAAVIGPSGTGKSVFLSCLNGLLAPDSGKVYIDGVDLTDPKTDINQVRRRTGMVCQSFSLFSHLSVMENLTLAPRKLLGLGKEEARARAKGLLDLVGLREKAWAMPKTLSGGQQQRIAIARTMAMEPELLLLDEPASALDPAMAGEVLAVIRAFAAQGITMVIVTHEMEFAREVSNRVLYMDDMGIYEMGTPQEIFDHPKREKTRAFVQRLKTFHCEIHSKSFDFYHLSSQIELFCQKYRVSRESSYNIQLCVEEGIFYLLDRGLAGEISITLTYSEKEKNVELALDYDGPSRDPFEGGEEDLRLTLLRSKTEVILFHGKEGRNQLRMKLRGGNEPCKSCRNGDFPCCAPL